MVDKLLRNFSILSVAEWSKASNSGPMVVSSKSGSDISVEVTSQC